MILRPQVVGERLDHLRSVTLRLAELNEIDREQFLSSYRLQWIAERGLQLAAQGVFDIGTHILSGHFDVHPADYEDVIRLLAAHGVLPVDLERRLRGLGGFRNILVYGYLDIDADRVHTFSSPRVVFFASSSRPLTGGCGTFNRACNALSRPGPHLRVTCTYHCA